MVKESWLCSDCQKPYLKKEDAIECEKKHAEYEKEQEVKRKENAKMIFNKGIEIDKSCFDDLGGYMDFKIPDDCDCVILMGNKGGGLIPYQLLLPHQVYVSDLKDTFKEEGFEVIVLIPIKSKDYMNIAYKDKYSFDRWVEKETVEEVKK